MRKEIWLRKAQFFSYIRHRQLWGHTNTNPETPLVIKYDCLPLTNFVHSRANGASFRHLERDTQLQARP